MSIRNVALLSGWLFLALFALPAAADYLDDIGFTALKASVGSGLADGSSVRVTQVEAPITLEITVMGVVVELEVWSPDPSHAQFSGVSFHNQTLPVPAGLFSSHATTVARQLVGETHSLTPGVTDVDNYAASDWVFSALNMNNIARPAASTSRVTNHSWISSFEMAADNVQALQRIDWLINRDNVVQVVGNGNDPQAAASALWSNAHNVIAVGATHGDHSSGTTAFDSIYQSGRANPHVVAPLGDSSNATAVVSSAATLLIDTALENPGLSLEANLTPRLGGPIPSAASAEVIKAVIMAGADRHTNNPSAANISDYRLNPHDQTTNGLDRRFGAGQLNILQSYNILVAGEQHSAEDGGSGTLLPAGFDYDPSFGGFGGSNFVATYAFSTDQLAAELSAALVWNLSVDEGVGPFAPNPVLHNLDLQLWETTGSGDVLVASSMSSFDNTENIWQLLTPNTDYFMRVINSSGSDFEWDYALAWDLRPVPLPAALPLLALGLLSLVARGKTKTLG